MCWPLTVGGLNLLRGRVTDHGRLGLLIIVATIPAVLFGLFVKKTGVIDAVRGPEIVAWNAIIFGVFMYIADRFGKQVKAMENMTFMPALAIGLAQAVAIIPGTSRSGITMTAARFLGFQALRGSPVFVPGRHSGHSRRRCTGARRGDFGRRCDLR